MCFELVKTTYSYTIYNASLYGLSYDYRTILFKTPNGVEPFQNELLQSNDQNHLNTIKRANVTYRFIIPNSRIFRRKRALN